MLFNSLLFLLLFLPVALLVHYLLGARSLRAAAAWLCLTSFVFYGWWKSAPASVVLNLIWLLIAAVTLWTIWKRKGSSTSAM